MTTLTLSPNVALARMDVVVQDAIGGTLVRTDPDGSPTAVRAGTDLVGDLIVWDYECPFGVEVTYSLDDDTASSTLNVTTSQLSHPTDVSLSYTVTVVDDDDWSWTAPGSAFQPIGSQWPVIVYSTRTEHRGVLLLATEWADRADVHALLIDGGPLLLRTPPTVDVDDKWLWPESVRRTKSRPHDPAYVLWELSYQRCARPAGVVTQDPSNNWTAVTLTHATWSALVISHPTWLDLVLDAHPHGMVDNARHAHTADSVVLT